MISTLEDHRQAPGSAIAGHTRFARWRPRAAGAMLLAFAALLLISASIMPSPHPDKPAISSHPALANGEQPTDVDLYRAIAARVAAGDNYYRAAVAEQKKRTYPVRPFVTVRLPTLALIEATLGSTGARLLLFALGLATALVFTFRCRALLGGSLLPLAVTVAAEIGMLIVITPNIQWWHEIWAGVFILLSLSLRAPGRFVGAVLAGLAAAAIRELALPYLVVMAATALWDGERREAAAWASAIAIAALGLAAHAWGVASVVTAGDPASPGWTAFGGWRFILSMMQECTVCAILPWTAVVILPLCLLGWAAWPGELGMRGGLVVAGYLSAFNLVGRSDNVYWMFMLSPLLFAGLGFAPWALADLVRAIGRSRESLTLAPSGR